MALTMDRLRELQEEAMADDVDLEESMLAWTEAEARVFLESGGTLRPPSPEAWRAWLPYWREPKRTPQLRVVCFHPMGSSAIYWHAVDKHAATPQSSNPLLSEGVELLALELPGRERRRQEAPYESVHTLTDDIVTLLAPMLTQGIPYLLLGHSMGTWIAFNTCLKLLQQGVPPPKALCISNFPSPRSFFPRAGSLPPPLPEDGVLPESHIEEQLKWGAPREAFRAEALRVWYPAYLADAKVIESVPIPPDDSPRLPVPIWATYGASDPSVSSEHVQQWRALSRTDDDFEMVELAKGEHLFHKVESFRQDAFNALLDMAGVAPTY
jgi:medium-chain acyl-[acyl-carrier-protein] hydrolase